MSKFAQSCTCLLLGPRPGAPSSLCEVGRGGCPWLPILAQCGIVQQRTRWDVIRRGRRASLAQRMTNWLGFEDKRKLSWMLNLFGFNYIWLNKNLNLNTIIHMIHLLFNHNARERTLGQLPKMCLLLQLFEAASEPMKKWRPLWNWLGHLVSSSSIPNKEACTEDHPLTPPFVNPLHWILSGPYFNDKSTFPKEKQLCLSIRKLNNAMCIQYYPNPSLYVSRPY